MSIYKKIVKIGVKIFKKSTLFKYGFNWSPMYRRTTARIMEISEDLLYINIKIPISYKNRNYMNTIFGGVMFSAVDPIPMIQVFDILGDDYVVWDRSAEIIFKKPAKEDLYAEFIFTPAEIEEIKIRVSQEKEIDIIKIAYLTNKEKTITFCEVKKIIYIAEKEYYKQKRKKRNR